MKKYISSALTFVALPFLFLSCASTQISLASHSPIALISVIGNSNTFWFDEDDEDDGDGILTSTVNKFLDSKNPEILTAVDRLDYAVDSFSQIVPEITSCEVIEKNAVISSEKYKNLRASYFNALASTKVATDFKDLSTIGSKNARILMKDLNAKSLVVLEFKFKKQLLTGTRSDGEIVGFITMKVKIFNEKGKEIINKIYTDQTPTSTKILSRNYDKDAFITTFNEGIDNIIRKFAVDFISQEGIVSDSANSNSIEETEEIPEVKGTPIKLPPKSENALP